MAVLIRRKNQYISLFVVSILLFIAIEPALAQTTAADNSLDILWLLVAGSLVFFMNAGFAMLEAGLCQTRNSTNVLAKNLIVFCISILAFWILGFGLMFGNGNSWIGATGFFFQAFDPPLENIFDSGFDSLELLYPGLPLVIVFFFQLVFAGTTATIVSGAMAERVKFWAFFWFSFLLVGIAYPITGRWIWNPDGWLAANYNFIDFAGSTAVHSVGGMAGLVGAILIGPRRGWKGYNPDAAKGDRFSTRPQTFGYYNLSLSTLGCLILWLGWLGFNGGSARSVADAPHVIATTMIAGASGGIFMLLLRGLRTKKLRLPLVINGILGGLVSITASSIYVSLAVAVLIGAIGSLWIIIIEQLLENLCIDDPVGAIPVHLGCGIWGTLAAGLFANQLPPYINEPVVRIEQIFNQIVGIIAVNSTILVLSLAFWLIVGLTIHTVDYLNTKLKDQRDSLSAPLRDRTLYSNTDSSNSNIYRGFSKYFYYAQRAIRVSLEEESKGSDGTFS